MERSEAFDEGRSARMDGQSILSDPYPMGSAERDAWQDGWWHEAELEGAESC